MGQGMYDYIMMGQGMYDYIMVGVGGGGIKVMCDYMVMAWGGGVEGNAVETGRTPPYVPFPPASHPLRPIHPCASASPLPPLLPYRCCLPPPFLPLPPPLY